MTSQTDPDQSVVSKKLSESQEAYWALKRDQLIPFSAYHSLAHGPISGF